MAGEIGNLTLGVGVQWAEVSREFPAVLCACRWPLLILKQVKRHARGLERIWGSDSFGVPT